MYYTFIMLTEDVNEETGQKMGTTLFPILTGKMSEGGDVRQTGVSHRDLSGPYCSFINST